MKRAIALLALIAFTPLFVKADDHKHYQVGTLIDGQEIKLGSLHYAVYKVETDEGYWNIQMPIPTTSVILDTFISLSPGDKVSFRVGPGNEYKGFRIYLPQHKDPNKEIEVTGLFRMKERSEQTETSKSNAKTYKVGTLISSKLNTTDTYRNGINCSEEVNYTCSGKSGFDRFITYDVATEEGSWHILEPVYGDGTSKRSFLTLLKPGDKVAFRATPTGRKNTFRIYLPQPDDPKQEVAFYGLFYTKEQLEQLSKPALTDNVRALCDAGMLSGDDCR